MAAWPALGARIEPAFSTDEKGDFDDVLSILDAVTISAESPLAGRRMDESAGISVAAIFLAERSRGAIQLIFQGTDGSTKSRPNIQAPKDGCGFQIDSHGPGFLFSGDAFFSPDGGVLAAELDVRIQGTNTYISAVAVWTIEIDGTIGGIARDGVILCGMTELKAVEVLVSDEGVHRYLVVGADSSYLVER